VQRFRFRGVVATRVLARNATKEQMVEIDTPAGDGWRDPAGA
jgi:hypothetical protein